MIALIARLAPGLVLAIGMALGAVPAAVGGWIARGVVFDHFERPAVIREATNRANDAATIRIMDAANRAEQATRTKIEQANADALALYRVALELSNRTAAAAEQQLETEIARYEAELALEGRSCPLDQRTLDWLQSF